MRPKELDFTNTMINPRREEPCGWVRILNFGFAHSVEDDIEQIRRNLGNISYGIHRHH